MLHNRVSQLPVLLGETATVNCSFEKQELCKCDSDRKRMGAMVSDTQRQLKVKQRSSKGHVLNTRVIIEMLHLVLPYKEIATQSWLV